MTITTMTHTRNHGTEAIGASVRNSIAGLVAAADALHDTLRAVRSNTDSAATAWVEVDGRAVDVTDIQMAASAADKRAAARAILAA